MSDDDIDLDRVINDPAYRRRVIEYLNIGGEGTAGGSARRPQTASGGTAEHERRDRALG